MGTNSLNTTGFSPSDGLRRRRTFSPEKQPATQPAVPIRQRILSPSGRDGVLSLGERL
jgi:hypothetical protein